MPVWYTSHASKRPTFTSQTFQAPNANKEVVRGEGARGQADGGRRLAEVAHQFHLGLDEQVPAHVRRCQAQHGPPLLKRHGGVGQLIGATLDRLPAAVDPEIRGDAQSALGVLRPLQALEVGLEPERSAVDAPQTTGECFGAHVFQDRRRRRCRDRRSNGRRDGRCGLALPRRRRRLGLAGLVGLVGRRRATNQAEQQRHDSRRRRQPTPLASSRARHGGYRP